MAWQSVADYKAASDTPSPTTPPQPAAAQPNPAPSAPTARPAQAPPSEPAPTPTTSSPTPASNAAVQRCLSAYQQVLAATKDTERAKDAYKNALPFLTDRASILNFMACVIHGMVLKIFWNDQGPRLITAAKATLAALPKEAARTPEHAARAAGRPAKEKNNPVLEN